MLPGLITVPTKPFATWNPSNTGSVLVLSGNNLTANNPTFASSWNSRETRCTKGLSAGKWYCELKLIAKNSVNFAFGMSDNTTGVNSKTNILGLDANSYGIEPGQPINSFATGVTANGAATTPTSAVNDIYMMAFDADGDKLYAGANGTWYNSGNPGAGTGHVASGFTGTWYFAFNSYDANDTMTANFGNECSWASRWPKTHLLSLRPLRSHRPSATASSSSSLPFSVHHHTGRGAGSREDRGHPCGTRQPRWLAACGAAVQRSDAPLRRYDLRAQPPDDPCARTGHGLVCGAA
jgi:hypothetical protein